ncbi:purine nucleoside phosphorylase-like isoform X2 [Macrosteles quadrilineatus]|uniref:purine nucleoside phosphorylase-like isoform X2 n=1 Tax=Macrosteles quadrilineatus TaxID=74068 RepID=UPI0023E2551C|nr:purine nucleoside phosphorylase-like isoform X2 [Macrosteles quadrilineatus]XP_054288159.1 purine nucleoside phosphorylase-like isoform X2 [Macrosteles quadrilineatus]
MATAVYHSTTFGQCSRKMKGTTEDTMAPVKLRPLRTPSGTTIAADLASASNHENPYTYELVESIAKYLLDRVPESVRPTIGIICGSGMGPLADMLSDKVAFPYETIPHFPQSTVPGHAGRLVFGKLNGIPIMCMQGRFHYYEGYPLSKCSMPVRVMKLVGVTHLVVTNAAGGLNPEYEAGDIMIMKDHVNFMGFAGNNPLQGINDERFGPRFPAMNRAYNAKLLSVAKEVAKELNMEKITKEGVYAQLGGPNFETIAELRMLRTCGVDAVGMSTVAEVLTAHHCGMYIFAFSLITNMCIMDYDSLEEANHTEVIQIGKLREPLLKKFVARMVSRLPEIQKTQQIANAQEA